MRLTVETGETERPTGDPLEALTKAFSEMAEEEIRLVEEVALDRSSFMRPPPSE